MLGKVATFGKMWAACNMPLLLHAFQARASLFPFLKETSGLYHASRISAIGEASFVMQAALAQFTLDFVRDTSRGYSRARVYQQLFGESCRN